MSSYFRKSISDKIILLTSLTFVIFLLSGGILFYFLLEEDINKHIQDFSFTSFNSFGNSIDKVFSQIEKSGEKYCSSVIYYLTDNELNDHYEFLTATVLESNPYISEIVVLLSPDIEYQNAVSFYFINIDQSTQKGIINLSQDTIYSQLINSPITQIPINNKSSY